MDSSKTPKTIRTVFADLVDLLSPMGRSKNGFPDENDLTKQPQEPQREILHAASIEDAREKVLQMAQGAYMRNAYTQKSYNEKNLTNSYEANRILQYTDYVQLENFPPTKAALDLYAEEATTVGHDGYMLRVYSDNPRVKAELEKLYYEILDVNSTLFYWTRTLCKYGDFFLLLLPEEGKGITAARAVPVPETDRIEEEIDGHPRIQFRRRFTQQGEERYSVFQMAHFRLLGDDRRMPYGMSMLDCVRRVSKMIMMAQDAYLTYLLERAGERRIHRVMVGNAGTEEIDQLVDRAANRYKSAPIIDPRTGDFNWKFKPASQTADIFVPVRNESTTNPIEVLPGASNIDAMSNIDILEDALYTGLGIPKAFLSRTGDGGGEGKSLPMLDMHFARKINRLQQAVLAGLNQIGVIHLYLLGGDFQEHAGKFRLTLANPSTQADLLKHEALSSKLDNYQKATTQNESGIKPMSETRAKMEILGWSFDEVLEDMQDQFLENKVGDELKSAGQLLRTSGVNDKYIKFRNAGFFQDVNGKPTSTQNGGEGGDAMGGAPGGPPPGDGMGGAPMGNEPPGGPPPPSGPPLNEARINKLNRKQGLEQALEEERQVAFKRASQFRQQLEEAKVFAENNNTDPTLLEQVQGMVAELDSMLGND